MPSLLSNFDITSPILLPAISYFSLVSISHKFQDTTEQDLNLKKFNKHTQHKKIRIFVNESTLFYYTMKILSLLLSSTSALFVVCKLTSILYTTKGRVKKSVEFSKIIGPTHATTETDKEVYRQELLNQPMRVQIAGLLHIVII